MDGNTCKCHIVVRWQPVPRSDEDIPIYAKCPIHPPQFDTDGYGETPLADVLGYDVRDWDGKRCSR